MAVAYQSSTQVTWGASPRVITKPSGTIDGDLLVLVVVHSGTSTMSTPSGFTSTGRFPSSVSNRTINVFWKTASSEGSSYSITTSSPDTCCFLFRIDGQETTSTVYTYNAEELANQSNPSINASITPTYDNSMLMMITSCNVAGSPTGMSNYSITTSNPTWTEREELLNGTYGNVGIATAIRPEITATGNLSFSNGGTSVTDNCAFILAIRRKQLFSFSTLDTVTTSDVISIIRSKFINVLETISLSEVLKIIKSRLWRSVSKPSTTWRNRLK